MTLLQTFQMVTLRPGWVELPASYAEALMAKGAGHKYIKRVPKAGGGYRYFYHVAHGGGVHAAEHFVEGASFRYEGGHYHITKVDGSRVTVRHDESGKTETFTKADLASALREHHAGALKAHHDKATKDLADAKKAGASAKQLAKLEKRVKVGAETENWLDRAKRREAEMKPRVDAIKAMERDAAAPVSESDAASVNPKMALEELASAIPRGDDQRKIAETPHSYSSTDHTRISMALYQRWQKDGEPITFYINGALVSGIASDTKRVDSGGRAIYTGTMRAPETPAEYAAIADHAMADARDYHEYQRSKKMVPNGDPGIVEDAERIARAQKLATAIKAHARVSSGLPAADEIDTHRSAASARGLKLEPAPGGNAYVSGPGTFDNKDKIKAAGGRWNGPRKTWTVPASNLGAMLKGAPSSWL